MPQYYTINGVPLKTAERPVLKDYAQYSNVEWLKYYNGSPGTGLTFASSKLQQTLSDYSATVFDFILENKTGVYYDALIYRIVGSYNQYFSRDGYFASINNWQGFMIYVERNYYKMRDPLTGNTRKYRILMGYYYGTNKLFIISNGGITYSSGTSVNNITSNYISIQSTNPNYIPDQYMYYFGAYRFDGSTGAGSFSENLPYLYSLSNGYDRPSGLNMIADWDIEKYGEQSTPKTITNGFGTTVNNYNRNPIIKVRQNPT